MSNTSPEQEPTIYEACQVKYGSLEPLNYGSLEACQRLVKAGIVLEFEYCWFPDVNSKTGWSLNRCFGNLPSPDCVPAHQMAEVWRKLPWFIDFRKEDAEFLGLYKHGEETGCGYGDLTAMCISTNPTDAMINLLIWVTEQRKEK
jgi:hypothetical protein